MSDANMASGTGTPAPVVTSSPAPANTAPPPAAPPQPPAAPVAPPPPAAVAAPTEPQIDAAWLNDRLTRAKGAGRQDLLTELGVTDPATAKAAIAAAKAAEDATKSAEQRALEASGRATTLEVEKNRLSALAKEQAGRMLMVLTPDQQKAVTDFAGEDPAEQLRAIHHFAPLWSKAAQEAAAASAAVAPPAGATGVNTPPAPPANTAPPPVAPPSAAPGSPPDHRTVYTTLAQTDPFAAAAYGLKNFSAVHTPRT